jgi:hypothetical protein
MKYCFGWSNEDAVECPELDSLIEDVVAAFEKHGAGISLEGGYDDESAKIVLVKFEQDDFNWLTDHLREYSGGIPWLDEAKARYNQNNIERCQRYEAAKAAKAAAQKAKLEAQKQAAIDAAVRDGIELAGKRYRLVEQ